MLLWFGIFAWNARVEFILQQILFDFVSGLSSSSYIKAISFEYNAFGWQSISVFFLLFIPRLSSFWTQTSRIEIKKGPNGVDYEYEYVYYYYDDDESDSGSAKKPASPAAVEVKAPVESTRTSSSSSSSSNAAGKTRYTATDRSNNSAVKPTVDRNEIPASRGKGRQSIPVIEEVAEERLPAITRFPPRSGITPSVQVISSVEETTKKISVKRPSLDLVDSHSFNRGDKKGTRVTSEFDKDADAKAKKESDEAAEKLIAEATTAAVEADETTTQVMDKVALDLYAHLANENSNVDATTEVNADDESVTTNGDGTEGTPSTEEYTTVEATTLIATTSTTTTPAPTTTTTTTTTEAPQPINGRRAPFGAGRNRYRSRPTARTAVSEIPVEVREASSVETSQVKPKSKHSSGMERERGNLIVFSSFFRSFLASIIWRPITNNDFDSCASHTRRSIRQTRVEISVRTSRKKYARRTRSPHIAMNFNYFLNFAARNRFNLRTSTAAPSTEEKHADENVVDETVPPTSSTARAHRARPAFNARGRSRTTTASSTAAPTAEGEVAEGVEHSEVASEKPAAPAKPASRFNLRRPNQLLAGRGRSPLLAKATTPSTEAPSDSNGEVVADSEKSASDQNKGITQEVIPDENESSQAETSTQAVSGLNKLRNRPRLQVHAAAAPHRPPTGSAVYNNANRKANPLIARRRNLSSSTTTTTGNCHWIEYELRMAPITIFVVYSQTEEAPVEQSDVQEEQPTDSEENYAEDESNNAKEEQTEAAPVEVSSEQPRGLSKRLAGPSGATRMVFD